MVTLKKYWNKFGNWFSRQSVWGKIVFGIIVISFASGGWTFSIFLIIVWLIKSNYKGHSRNKSENEMTEAKAFLDPIIESKTLPIIPVDINLQKDESCCYMENNVALSEEKDMRVSRGSGASGRIWKGFWIHSYGSKSISVPQMQKVDTGTLLITNKRLVFLGKFNNKSIKNEDILATHQYSDAIKISVSSNGKNEYFYVNNPMLFRGMMSLAPYGENLKKIKNINFKYNIV